MDIPIANQKFNGLLGEIYISEKALSMNKGFQCMETLNVNSYIPAAERGNVYISQPFM